MSKSDIFCRLPEIDAARHPSDKEIYIDGDRVYVIVPRGYEADECFLIIPKGHYASFAEAALADPVIMYDATVVEKDLVEDFFGGGDYWCSENCGEAGGRSGRTVAHAHRWLINCSDGSKNAAGMGVAWLRDVVNFLPRQSIDAARAACVERRGS